ncbi:unnamed protein product [Phytophthora fragariaefolia]|uniref:Unnamed protein product n=1 Tax=Phytophthora fragariaefolia TaxID=1490495 RepID=A0A9W6XQ85_9STRA|nr:unnamed protein product [Phytophthora fragariaefolia]
MPKSNAKENKPPPATETTPKDVAPSAGKASKRKEVRLPGPYVEPAPSESDTDTTNPDLITGDEDSTADSTAPRATKPSEGKLPSANITASEPAPVEEAPIPSPEESSNVGKAEGFLNSSDTHDPKVSASATPPAKAPQERSPPPGDGPDPVDYDESEPDQDREQGEVPDPNSSPQLTEQQREAHLGSPMTPKTTAAVARVEAQAQCESHRDTAPTGMSEQQIITNAGIDEGFHRNNCSPTTEDISVSAPTKKLRKPPALSVSARRQSRGPANSCSHCDIGHSTNIANTFG